MSYVDSKTNLTVVKLSMD